MKVDLTGRRFGRLTVLFPVGPERVHSRQWFCRCDCGGEATVTTHDLNRGSTKSCGCWRKEFARTHGAYGTVEYYMLRSAKRRAQNAGLPFDLKLSDIKIPKRCPLLNVPIVRSLNSPGPNSPSLDRLCPTKGYVKGNVLVISYRANAIKRDASLAELQLLTRNLEKYIGA